MNSMRILTVTNMFFYIVFFILCTIHVKSFGNKGINLFRNANKVTQLQMKDQLAPSTSNYRIFRIRDDENSDRKPSILYIPGLDGKGDYSTACYERLCDEYDCWRLEVDSTDRSSFLTLATGVVKALKNFSSPPTVIGESFGGLLTFYLAARYPQYIKHIVIINPATSLANTPWRSIAPLIASTGPLYPIVGLSSLAGAVVEGSKVIATARGVQQRLPPNASPQMVLEAVTEQLKPLIKLPDTLPADTLAFRMKDWLDTGNFLVQDQLTRISLPVLLLIGAEDRLLPSRQEGNRLNKVLSQSPSKKVVKLKVFPNRGHALLDPDFPLSSLLQEFNEKVERELGRNFTLPPPGPADVQELEERLKWLYQFTSPVFFSANKEGEVVRGVEAVPTGQSGRPVLFVGNHQLLGMDMGLLIGEFLRRGVRVRGLAHPLLFQSEGGKEMESMGELFQRFGAVPVSPMNYFELLKNNETILLYPGGAREALHGKGEDYQLFWPERTDFVRMAEAMDAIIVPFAAVGAADSLKILLDAKEVADRTPSWLSSRVRTPSAPTMTMRPPTATFSPLAESLLPPLVAPQPPSRFYFFFLPPIDTREWKEEAAVGIGEIEGEKGSRKKRKGEMYRAAYSSLTSSVQGGIETLLSYRQLDPFLSFWSRSLGGKGKGENGEDFPPPPAEKLREIWEKIEKKQRKEGKTEGEEVKGEEVGYEASF